MDRPSAEPAATDGERGGESPALPPLSGEPGDARRADAVPEAAVPQQRDQDAGGESTETPPEDDDGYAAVGHSRYQNDAVVAEVSTRAMAARLPYLVGKALRLGWDADRRVLVALLVCQVTAGVLEAAGLMATT